MSISCRNAKLIHRSPILIVLMFLSRFALAQDTTLPSALPSALPTAITYRPYPSSELISPQSLAPETRAIIEQLFRTEIPVATFRARDKDLCPQSISKVAPVDDSANRAIATTDVAVALELFFERNEPPTGLELSSFSVVVEFSPTRVFLQHSAPRFPSDAGGFTAPMANATTRPVRLEGRLGADILALIAPLKECRVQAVAFCARRYTKEEVLLRAPYSIKAIRPLINAKSDGVYAPPNNSTGRLMVSLLGSAGLKLPKPWFTVKEGSGTLSEAISISTPREQRTSQPTLTIEKLPTQVAVESRADFGNSQGVVRTAIKRANIELSTIDIPDINNLEVGTSALSIEGGECYLVTRWLEEIL
jgi:hypothetical protein